MAADTGVEYYLYNHTQPVLSFTPEEESRGREKLEAMGVSDQDWFVCIHARDGKYFHDWRPELGNYWSTMDFRSIAIENYVEAAEFIASQGGFVLRYGANVEEPFPVTNNQRIIDYSTHHREDFMDIYLVAKCRFFLGCCAGPLALASAFNIPIVSVNHHPYNFGYYQTNQTNLDIFVQRHLVSPDNPNRIVPFWEAMERGYFDGWGDNSSMHPTDKMYDMLPTSSHDILDACKDMLDGLNGITIPDDARAIQSFYAEQYLSNYPEYLDSAKIAPRYAKKYSNLILPSSCSSD